eukprot:6189267-Pleurochrysis_carterae.AAC.1
MPLVALLVWAPQHRKCWSGKAPLLQSFLMHLARREYCLGRTSLYLHRRHQKEWQVRRRGACFAMIPLSQVDTI